MTTVRRWLVAFLALALPLRSEAEPDEKLLSDLALMTMGQAFAAKENQRWRTEIISGRASLADYVDALLLDRRFAVAVAPGMLLGTHVKPTAHALSAAYVLKSVTEGGPRVYHLRAPCLPAAAERVRPWWAMDTEILVCPDSHRPGVQGDGKGASCGAHSLDPAMSRVCGCGPNLMHCARDGAHLREIRRSLAAEVTDTLAHVIAEDRPLKELYRGAATVRDRNAEYVYRRWAIASGLPESFVDLGRWPHDGVLAPRRDDPPGQHAGLLTTPHLQAVSTSPRGRMRDFFDLLWCEEPDSINVATQAVLGLGALDLRLGEGWRKLAAMPICTKCHARIDHGAQFFKDYPSPLIRIDALVGQVRATPDQGTVYGRDIDDPRRHGDLSPAAFAAIVTEEPEFGRCMARRVADHVFRGRASAEDLEEIGDAFRRRGTLREMMRVALTRYARRLPSTPRPATAPAAAPPPALAPDEVRLPDGVAALVEEHCGHCHAGAPGVPDLSSAVLSRRLLDDVLTQVAFGRMPKGAATLDHEVRATLVAELVDLRFVDPAQRRTARRYFETGMHALRVLRIEAAIGVVGGGDGRELADRISLVEGALPGAEVRYTPGYAAVVVLEALRVCHARGHVGAALEDCVAGASAPARVILGAAESGRKSNQRRPGGGQPVGARECRRPSRRDGGRVPRARTPQSRQRRKLCSTWRGSPKPWDWSEKPEQRSRNTSFSVLGAGEVDR